MSLFSDSKNKVEGQVEMASLNVPFWQKQFVGSATDAHY